MIIGRTIMDHDQPISPACSVGVVGLGRIGGIIVKCLLECQGVDNVLVFTRSQQAGFWEEARQINRHHIGLKQADGHQGLSACDYIFLALSIDYAVLLKGKEIHDSWILETEGNVRLVEALLPQLLSARKKTIIVYTNPVDIICHYLGKTLDGSNRVFGFGSSLDTLRLRNLLGLNGMVVGEHGVSMVPLGVSDQRGEIQAARAEILGSVARVVQDQGYTALGPEMATREFLQALFGGQASVLPMSAHQADLGISMGSPCQVAAGQIVPLPWEMNRAEAGLWRESAAKIKRDLEQADI
jgi:malate/lactate dehydrogenase